MKKEAFVISDIHGMYDLLDEMLTYWNKETQQLIFVGDLIDRGPASLKTIEKVKQLQRDYGAICLCGNHEDMLRETLLEPQEYYGRYKRNSGLTTISELLNRPQAELEETSGEELAQQLNQTQPWLLEWLEQLPLYYQFGNFLIVHGGVNPELENWQDSSRRDFVWIREPFHSLPNQTGYQIIFGHTPVSYLHEDKGTDRIWQRDTLIGIDGGAVYGGSLYAVRINQQQLLEVYRVENREEGVADE